MTRTRISSASQFVSSSYGLRARSTCSASGNGVGMAQEQDIYQFREWVYMGANEGFGGFPTQISHAFNRFTVISCARDR